MAKLNVSGDSEYAQEAFLASRRILDRAPGDYDLCEGRGKSACASERVSASPSGPALGVSLDLSSPVDRYYATATYEGLFD